MNALSSNVLDNREVARLFDRAAGIYDLVSNSYTMARRAAALAAWVKGTSIEVGGGTAAVSAGLRERSHAFHSDISHSMCRVARDRINRPSACFDAECMPLANQSFDSIVAGEMIYYLGRPERFVSEAFRALRPGGRLILSTTNPLMTVVERGRTFLRELGFRHMFFDDGSPRFLPARKVTFMLNSSGFEVEHLGGIVPIPFRALDRLNRILESTPLWRRP